MFATNDDRVSAVLPVIPPGDHVYRFFPIWIKRRRGPGPKKDSIDVWILRNVFERGVVKNSLLCVISGRGRCVIKGLIARVTGITIANLCNNHWLLCTYGQGIKPPLHAIVPQIHRFSSVNPPGIINEWEVCRNSQALQQWTGEPRGEWSIHQRGPVQIIGDLPRVKTVYTLEQLHPIRG